MYNNLNIGQNAAGIFAAPAFSPISRIALLVDDENEYLSGDDSGRTLEVTCPYGSQAMADDLLAQLKGYAYQPMTAQDALLDPAAEIGDSVTVGGVYTILAQIDTLFDMHCAADIAAPGEEELESEYTFQTQEKRLERKLAQTRSLIAKTAEEVKISVEELNGKYTALSVTLDGVTITDQDGTTKIRGSSIETDTLKVKAANIEGKLTASQVEITLEGAITWEQLSPEVQNEINDAYAMAEDAEAAAADAADTVDGWRYNGGTYIDGNMLMTGTVKASELLGGTVGLLTNREALAGGIDITGASSSGFAIELYSEGALRLEAYDGALYLGSDSASMEISNYIWCNDHIFPSDPETYNCGNNNYPWAMVSTVDLYVDGAAVTSDRNKKHNIFYGLDAYDALFDALRAVGYKLNNGKSDRVHIGMIAQDVEKALLLCGLTNQDFGAVVREIAEDGTERYFLRYMEFIGLLIDQVQKLKARMGQLEARV